MAMENAHHGALKTFRAENQAMEMEKGKVIVRTENIVTTRVIVVHCAQNRS